MLDGPSYIMSPSFLGYSKSVTINHSRLSVRSLLQKHIDGNHIVVLDISYAQIDQNNTQTHN